MTAAPITPPTPPEGVDKDFKYIVRLADTDLDGNRSTVYGLTRITGVGIRIAEVLVARAGVQRMEKLGNIKDDKILELENLLKNLADIAPPWILNRQHDFWTGEDSHLYGPDVQVRVKDDVNRMRMIRCYKGVRHETGQKVRGQRTRSNGRTGLTVGVLRKDLKAQIAEKKAEEEGKGKEEKPAGKAPEKGPAKAPVKAPAKPAEKAT